jgi:hypothetical protein
VKDMIFYRITKGKDHEKSVDYIYGVPREYKLLIRPAVESKGDTVRQELMVAGGKS